MNQPVPSFHILPSTLKLKREKADSKKIYSKLIEVNKKVKEKQLFKKMKFKLTKVPFRLGAQSEHSLLLVPE